MPEITLVQYTCVLASSARLALPACSCDGFPPWVTVFGTFLSLNGQDWCAGEKQEGSRAARMLHMVRRAERGLMSYDR